MVSPFGRFMLSRFGQKAAAWGEESLPSDWSRTDATSKGTDWHRGSMIWLRTNPSPFLVDPPLVFFSIWAANHGASSDPSARSLSEQRAERAKEGVDAC